MPPASVFRGQLPCESHAHYWYVAIRFLQSLGIDFKIKKINVDEKRVKLQVWDTAGQERFRTITQTYYKGAMGIILVYDCTDQQTFNNISNWLKQIEQHASTNVAKVLVANKCDRTDKIIESSVGKALADQHGLLFFETSAKNGHNVAEVF
jgi:Ras-related protein Rab-8A